MILFSCFLCCGILSSWYIFPKIWLPWRRKTDFEKGIDKPPLPGVIMFPDKLLGAIYAVLLGFAGKYLNTNGEGGAIPPANRQANRVNPWHVDLGFAYDSTKAHYT